MADRPRGGLAALCIAVTTSWGLLYYALPVAVTPISEDTGWSHTAITGAFSAGLVVSALAGIRVGRLLDSRGPRGVMTPGALVGVAAMALVGWAPSLPVFVLAWLLAGFAQATLLYPPAFAVITRWYGPRRLGPLTTLTLVAGLASTIFAPITAFLVEQFSWRLAFVIMAGILAVTTLPLHAFFLNSRWSDTSPGQADDSRADVRSVITSPRFIVLLVTMVVTTFTLLAVTINIIPLLLERGMSYSTAALALGLVGAGQLIGRIAYPQLAKTTSPRTRTVLIFGAGAAGLWALALIPGPHWLLVVVGVLVGAVRGCHTLLQATGVSDRWGTRNFGELNGIFNAPMTFAGALAPVAGPALASILGSYPAMAIAMAGILTLAALASVRT